MPSTPAVATPADWAVARLHVVTGKGGAGKTTVAAALALALAEGGGRVLLMEVEDRQGLAQLFDTPPLLHAETRLAAAPDGGEVYGLAVDPEEALLEYLEMFYNMRRAGGALRRLGAIDFATTIAPGMRDVLLTGKAKEAVRRSRGGARVYDAVVLDAPPTGRIARFLNVNHEVAGLARVGPIRNHADGVMAVIASPLTTVHLVTLLEPMPVQETKDGVGELRGAGLPVGGVFVNMVREPLLAKAALTKARKGQLDSEQLAADLALAGLTGPGGPLAGNGGTAVLDHAVAALADEAADHATRVAMERQERAELARLGRPMFDLPWCSDGVDLGTLYELAAALRAQGAV
ncbi:MAG TPA: ArsA-related P-loop ATPase [Candidatus Nanopelagicales bacterium]|nr:ArsA-related P-loop ATPase [Candidatus Nanopelagicales bacterium]